MILLTEMSHFMANFLDQFQDKILLIENISKSESRKCGLGWSSAKKMLNFGENVSRDLSFDWSWRQEMWYKTKLWF